MRCILINPLVRKVSEIETDGNPDTIKKLLGCKTLRLVPIDEANALLVDEAGLEPPDQLFWKFTDNPRIVGGLGLIMGTDDEDTDLGAEELRVEWLRVKYTGFNAVSREDVDTAWGPGIAVTYVPTFEQLPEPEPEPEPAPEPKEYAFWTIVQLPDGFAAHRMLATARGTRATDIVLENEDLTTLRGLLPLGLQRVDRTATDHPDLLETWFP